MKRNHWLTLSSVLLLPLCCACGSSDDEDPGFAGKTYVLEIGGGDWLDPIGGEVEDYVPQFWMQVDGSVSNYQVTMTTAQEGAQVMCNKTHTTSASSNPYPGFSLGPTDFPLYLRHKVQPVAVQTTAYDLTMTDVLPTGAKTDQTNLLTAKLDAREIYPIFVAITPEPTPDALCEQVADKGAPCVACKDGEEYCLEMRAGYLEAMPGDVTITPVGTPDPACLELE